MKKIAIFTVIAAIFFSSCDNFYGSSLGTSRNYDWRNINVTTSNISDWLHASVGNPPLAIAVTKAIIYKLENDTSLSGTDRAIFLEYASRLAMVSSSVGTSILLSGIDLIASFGSDASPEELVDKILGILDRLKEDFKTAGGSQAAADLAKLLSLGIDDKNGTPKFDSQYINRVKSNDVSEALIVLLLGEMEDNKDFDITNMDDLGALGLELTPTIPPAVQVMDGSKPSDNAIAIAAYLNLIIDNPGKFEDNFLTKAIHDSLIPELEIPEEEEEDENDGESEGVGECG